MPHLLIENRRLLSSDHLEPWIADVREQARVEIAELAMQSHLNLDRRFEMDSHGSLIVSGHQPELYHPGVWFKNFLIDSLGKRNGAASLNVIIDHDAARDNRLRVPSFEQGSIYLRSVEIPLMRPEEKGNPWHTLSTSSVDLKGLRRSIQQTAELLQSCGVNEPIIAKRFEELLRALKQTDNIADALSYFRHTIEYQHGLTHGEASLNRLCSRDSFGQFLRRCLVDSELLWTQYNRCCQEYRNRKRIRNSVQPVPDLQRSSDMHELPFWIYSTSHAGPIERRSVWVQHRTHQRVMIADHSEPEQRAIELELTTETQRWQSQWEQLGQRGIGIRPKALMTTLFLRCFVADLFVHGIGGGVYDEVTDAIIYRWLKIQPPKFMVASASLHLDMQVRLGKDEAGFGNEKKLREELHRMRSAPERFLNLKNTEQHILKGRHDKMLECIPPRGRKKEWHREMTQLRNRIHQMLVSKYQLLRSQLVESAQHRQQQSIRDSREYSFSLFPEQDLVPRLKRLVDALK